MCVSVFSSSRVLEPTHPVSRRIDRIPDLDEMGCMDDSGMTVPWRFAYRWVSVDGRPPSSWPERRGSGVDSRPCTVLFQPRRPADASVPAGSSRRRCSRCLRNWLRSSIPTWSSSTVRNATTRPMRGSGRPIRSRPCGCSTGSSAVDTLVSLLGTSLRLSAPVSGHGLVALGFRGLPAWRVRGRLERRIEPRL